MAVDAETGLHVGVRVRSADVAHHIAKTASFVGRERLNGLAVQVVRVEEREHHLRVNLFIYHLFICFSCLRVAAC